MATDLPFVASISPLLLSAFETYSSVPALDLQRVERPTGKSSSVIALEQFRGVRTTIAFFRAAREEGLLGRFREIIETHHPELLGYVRLVNVAGRISDEALLAVWCEWIDVRVTAGDSPSHAIKTLLAELGCVLSERKLTYRAVTLLNGLTLQDDTRVIDFGEGVVLRALHTEEVSALSSHDVTNEPVFSRQWTTLTTCLEYTTTCDLQFDSGPSFGRLDVGLAERRHTLITDVLRALHVLKSGKVGELETKISLTPRVLPFLSGHSSSTLKQLAFAGMTIEVADIDELLTLYTRLRTARFDALRIAADRLMDAEQRLSAFDALLDSVIGLETLLHPSNDGELGFRVGLNYAFLAPAEERRTRYERVTAVQKTRNKIVHGELNIVSATARVTADAETGKELLRDAIKRLLLSDDVHSTTKLDAAFWLDRILERPIQDASQLG